jgi:tripartite-type tricarboxylate transporter receptor subunit TctC
MKALRSAVTLLLALGAWLPAATAQVYPTQPVNLVVPFARDGSADMIGRAIAERMSVQLGQSVTVQNQPGGGGTVASRAVSKAAPDGYTLLVATNSTLVLAPILQQNTGYDPLSSFAPVSLLSLMPSLIVVNPNFPAGNFQELIDLVRSSPGRYRYAHSGVGSLAHLNGELIKSQLGLDLKDLAFRGPAAAAQAVASGEADMMFDVFVFFVHPDRASQWRPIAAMDSVRIPRLPRVPTVAEAGYPELTSYTWTGIVAPAGTPEPIIEVLNGAIRAALDQRETQATFAKAGLEAAGSRPEQFQQVIVNELTKWQRALPLPATAR